MDKRKKEVSKDSVRFQIEMMDYSPSIKKLHLAAFDLRFMADDLARTIQKEFPDNEKWNELLKSFDNTIADCLSFAGSIFPEYLVSLSERVDKPSLEGVREELNK